MNTNITKTVLLIFVITLNYNIYAQNIVSGNLLEAKSNIVKVTLTNTVDGKKYAERTNSNAFSISDVPSGTYIMSTEEVGYNYMEKTVNINSNTSMNKFMFKDEAITSQLYLGYGKNLLFLFEDLTNTQFDNPNGQVLNHWRHPPFLVYADRANAPVNLSSGVSVNFDWDFVSSQIASAGVTINEQNTSSGVNINFIYTNSVPNGAYALTEWNFSNNNYDVYYDKSYMRSTTHPRSTFGREALQAIGLNPNAADPAMVLYYQGSGGNNNAGPHHDELLVLKYYFQIPTSTDMSEYKSNVTTSISNVMPDVISLTGPIGTVSISSDVELKYIPVSKRDGDGEKQTPTITVKNINKGLEKIVTDSDCDGSIIIEKSWFSENSDYTASIKNVSGINGNSDVTEGNSISFKTGSIIVTPGNTSVITPTNNAKDVSTSVSYTWSISSNATKYNLEIASDANFLNLIKDVIVSKTDTIMQANGNRIYFARVRGENTDANGNWSSTSTFETINTAPTKAVISSPNSNESKDATQPITFTWTNSTDVDFDPISYKIHLWNNEKDTVMNNVTSDYILPANKLKPSSTYTYVIIASDGKLENISLENKLITKTNILTPGNTSIITPTNNAKDVSTSVSYTWSISSNATKYNLEIASDANFLNLIKDVIVFKTDTIMQANGNRIYFARLRGENTDANGNWSSTSTFETINTAPTKATNISLNNQSIDATIDNTAYWNKATDIDSDKITEDMIIKSIGWDTIIYKVTSPKIISKNILKGHTNYQITIRSTDGKLETISDDANFTTINHAPTKAVPISPNSIETVDVTKQISFIFNPSIDLDKDALSYKIHLYDNGKDTIILTPFIIPPNKLQDNTQYRYTIITSDGTTETTSMEEKINTKKNILIPTSTSLITPLNNSKDVQTNVYYNWSQSLNATKYNLEIATDAQFNNIIKDVNVIKTDTTMQANGNREYYARIRAENIDATSAWSAPIKFETINTAPTKPTILSPFNSSTPSYENDSLKINFVPSTDADIYDNVSTTVAVKGEGLDTVIINNTGKVAIAQERFKPNTPYTITTTSSDGREIVSDEISITASDYTGIEDITNKYSIQVYPNPGNGWFILKTGGIIHSVDVYSVSGIKVYNMTNCNQQINAEINLSLMLPGIYLMKANISGKQFYQKLIIQNKK